MTIMDFIELIGYSIAVFQAGYALRGLVESLKSKK